MKECFVLRSRDVR